VTVRNPAKNELSIHYMLLRQIVGTIGTLLPIVLLVGNTISPTTPRPDSMSGYYYTCVLLAALSNLLPSSVNAHWPLLFSFEALAVVAFGVSWFTKGRTMREIGSLLHMPASAGRPTPAVPELTGQP
jgi:hypothetical protein